MTGRRRRLWLAGLAALALVAVLVTLGTWQVRRLAWKQALVAQVAARVHAAPVPAPGPAAWPTIDAASAQYRRIVATGRYTALPPTFVQASTVRGAGWWVMSPFRTRDAFTLLVNRGFVPVRRASSPPVGEIRVTGLLRIGEPGGGFLRRNDPAADRWYSRDVAAIAAARGLADMAPYFVDAATGPDGPGQPVAGLAVISFPNNHLVYAVTWYALAAMVAAAFPILVRIERRRA